MARPRKFDEAKVLDAATDCFWQDGYEATSIRDLAARMGITGASLYNAFGGKRSLFRAVLQRYAERSTRERIARLDRPHRPLGQGGGRPRHRAGAGQRRCEQAEVDLILFGWRVTGIFPTGCASA